MTKIERADILLDAVGFIGDDIVAEASGMSSVIQIPSKLKLNLMVMRRLIAAMICLVLVSALTPLSVYLYNNYMHPASQPPVTSTEESDPPVTVDVTESDIPEGYRADGFIKFDILAADGNAKQKQSVSAFTLTSETDASRALYLEVRSFDGNELSDSLLIRGHALMTMRELNVGELVIFSAALNDDSDVVGYVDISVYSVIDGKLTKSEAVGIRHAEFDISSEESVTSSRVPVYNVFMTLESELATYHNDLLIIDTYSSDKDIIRHPDEKAAPPDINAERKAGKRTWSLDRICELFGYEPPVITEKEPVPDVTLENGLVLSYIETEDGRIFYNVKGCSTEPMAELRIPSEYNGIPIYTVETNVLSECRAETVIFPASLTMFYKQKLTGGVKRVIIECNDDTNFQLGAFRGSLIKEAVFTGNITFMPNETFYGCTELESVVFPETLAGIGEGAFQNCSSLREVNFPSGLRSIQKNAFLSCSSLQKIVFPEGFEGVGNSAFSGCVNVTEIVIPSTLKKIDKHGLSYHSCEVITLPEGVEYLGTDAVTGSKLRFLYLPRSLTYIDHNFLYTDELPIESVYYNGTKEEYAINLVVPQAGKNEYTIVCTDGIIEIKKP